MSSTPKTDQLIQNIACKNAWAKQARLSAPWSLSFLGFLLWRQRNYLLWTAFLILLQIGEIALLALVHFIYFPPESLEILRIVSSITILGILCAFNLRVLPRRKVFENLDQSNISTRQAAITLSKWLFSITSLLSLLLVLYMFFGTNLELSSPPIYRALILASILTFPFDIIMTFLFYNLRAFGSPWQPRYLRLGTGALYLLSFGFLVIDQPLGFLIMKLLPRVLIVSLLWTKAVRLPLRELFITQRRHFQLKASQFRTFLSNLWPAFGFYIALEASLFISFGLALRFDSNLALVLFFCHKLIHVGNVLGFKSNLMILRDTENAAASDHRKALRQSLARLAYSILLYSLFALIFFPVILLKKEVLFWVSPTGETLDLSLAILFSCLGLIFYRSIAGTWSSVLLTFPFKKANVSLATPGLTFLSFLTLVLAPKLGFSFTAPEIFFAFIGFDLFLIIVSSLLLWRGYRGLRSIEGFSSSKQIGLGNLMQQLKTSPTSKLLAHVQLHHKKGLSQAFIQRLDKLLEGRPFQFCQFSQRDFILVFAEPGARKEIQSLLVEKLLAGLDTLSFYETKSTNLDEIFGALFHSKNWKDSLYLTCFKASRFPSESPPKVLCLGRQIEQEGELSEQSEDFEFVLKKDNGWDLAQLDDKKNQELATSYLSGLRYRDPILSSKKPSSGRLFHLNKNGRPYLLAMLNKDLGQYAHSIKRAAFEYNLNDFLQTQGKDR